MAGLNPNIALSGTHTGGGQQQGGGGDVFGTMRGLMAMQDEVQQQEGRRQQNEIRKRLIEDDYAIRESLQRTQNPDDSIDELWKGGRANAASNLATFVYKNRKEKAEELEAAAKADKERAATTAQLFQGVNNQATHDMALEAAGKIWGPERGQEVARLIGPKYDPEKNKQIVTYGSTVSEHMTRQQNALKDYRDGIKTFQDSIKSGDDHNKAIAELIEMQLKVGGAILSTAGSESQRAGYTELLKGAGWRPEVLGAFDPQGTGYSPTFVERARRLALGVKGTADVTHQQNADALAVTNSVIAQQRADTAQQRADQAGGGTSPGGRGTALTANAQREVAKDERVTWAEHEAELARQFKTRTGGKIPNEADIAAEKDPKVAAAKTDQLRNIAADKLRIEDGFRKERGHLPMLATERALMRDPAKAGDLAEIRRKIRKLTGMKETPWEMAAKLARDIIAEKNPDKKLALQQQLGVIKDRFGLE